MNNWICPGFQAAGIASGIKKNGNRDLGLIFSEKPAALAGVLTRNHIQAAPVILCRERIGGRWCQAVAANSGNANCCTGEQGMADAVETVRITAAALGISEARTCVSSTGVIGEPLPMNRLRRGIPQAADALRPEGISDFAEAIMTTDRTPKTFGVTGRLSGGTVRLVGVAKGAGMIRPDMATMLCYVMTDASIAPELLQPVVTAVNARTFNCITIDGDTSTNDTLLVLANGISGVPVSGAADLRAFEALLEQVLSRLARMCVTDGEGVTKTVDLVVRGAATDADARRVADTVAHSSLVKTALFGEDANWGRIIAAIGRSGVAIRPEAIALFFDDVQMVAGGAGCGKRAEAAATRVLKQPAFTITMELGQGPGRARMITCDLSLDYVRINADYRS